MKKIIIPAVIILVTSLYFGCAKKKTNVEFDMLYTTDIAIPTYSAANQTYTFVSNDILTDISNKLSSNSTNIDLVGEMAYTRFDIAVKTPTTGNMTFIKQMKFYINASGQAEQQVAYKYADVNDTILATDKKVSFKINDYNLKNRFSQSSVYFRVKFMPRTIPPATTITVTHNIHVKAITE